jgi:hypothetical protein
MEKKKKMGKNCMFNEIDLKMGGKKMLIKLKECLWFNKKIEM